MQSIQWGVEKLNDIFRSKPVILGPTSRDFWWRLNALMHMSTVGIVLGKSHGRRSLVGCSPWGRWGSDTTERLPFHFSLSCIGEGNGNPLQCSCLENPRDGGAWWAAIYGVAQSRTRLKWLSSEGNGNPLQYSVPGTEEPGGLPSMGSHRVSHDWSNLAAAAAAG